MTDTKPLDAFLNEAGENPTNEQLEALLPKEPVAYVFTAAQWSIIKSGNEMIAGDSLAEMDFSNFRARVSAIEELVRAVKATSEPRITEDNEDSLKPEQETTVTLPVVLYLELFAGLHAAWHIANRGAVEFDTDEKESSMLELVNATHARALAYIQPLTSMFDHDFHGVDH